MTNCIKQNDRGFSLLETAVVVALAAVVVAFATPKLINAMRDYRLETAARQLTDLMNKAKAQAVANNRTTSIIVDTANRRIGILALNNDGSTMRTDYVNLPQGITFAMPPSVTAPVTGAPTASAVSFPAQGSSTTVFEQNFTSRGFPAVATAGQINVLYVTNGRNYRAVVLNSVGGLRTFRWESNQWTSLR